MVIKYLSFAKNIPCKIMNIFIFQLTDTTLQSVNNLNFTLSKKNILWEILVQSGWPVLVLFLFLAIGLYIFFERLLYINAQCKTDKTLLSSVKEKIVLGNLEEAKTFVTGKKTSFARVFSKGIKRIGNPIEIIESSMRNIVSLEVYQLNKKLHSLKFISFFILLFGSASTIIGLIKYLYNVNLSQNYDLVKIIAEMYRVFIPLATAIIFSIFLFMLYYILINKIKSNTNKLKAAAIDFIEILHEPSEQ